MPTGCDRLKWMLPSPKCPKAQTRTLGIAARQAALASAMKSATRETGTETSCLIEPPSRPCTSGRLSRSRHSAAILRFARGDRRVLDEAVLDGGGEGALEEAAEIRVGLRRGELDEGIGFVIAGKRAHRSRGVLQHDFEPEARHRLEGGQRIARDGAQAPEERRARRAASRRPTKAVARVRGRGNSFSTAAVMMPSVPSEPMKRCFRS